jgi:hypothetical protein
MNSSAPGIFAMVFPFRPATGTKIFGRAFNAPTLEEASFYADSTVGLAPATSSSLVLTFGPVQPLDPGDADGDGLNNSWEKALGIDDRLTADYDGDGMSDLDEKLAGSAPDDVHSLLAFVGIHEETGTAIQSVRVSFQSVPGKKYQIEFAPSLSGERVFTPVGAVVTAGPGEYVLQTLVEVPESGEGVFRIKLVNE